MSNINISSDLELKPANILDLKVFKPYNNITNSDTNQSGEESDSEEQPDQGRKCLQDIISCDTYTLSEQIYEIKDRRNNNFGFRYVMFKKKNMER